MTDFDRDRFSRPLIKQPGSTKATAYQRCTTFIKVLADTYRLTQYGYRTILAGVGRRKDLQLATAALAGNPDTSIGEWKDLIDSAYEAGGGSERARIGTGIHKLTESVDLEHDNAFIPDDYVKHIENYRRTMQDNGIAHKHIEVQLVNDELKVAGTADRISIINGEQYVMDIKTGANQLTYGAGEIAMQLAIYARSQFYDVATGERTSQLVNLDRAVVIALDADTAECSLHWVDIRRGWRAVMLAAQVHAWRKEKAWLTPMSDGLELLSQMAEDAQKRRLAVLGVRLMSAGSVDELTRLWRDNRDIWLDRHSEIAKKQRGQLRERDEIR